VLQDGPRILDCLEFDERLRISDGLADAAFLAMDLERLGAPMAARRFLEDYEHASGDDPPRSLEDHYIAYRAHVRCKVSCIRARQQPGPGVEALARDLAGLALRHLQRARVRLVLVGGLPGSGKSTVAERLATERGWLHLSSDLVRKELAGVPPGTHREEAFRAGLYSPDSTERTYRELLTRAQQALQAGRSVLLDASFTDGRWRQQARDLAARTASDLVELHCAAPPDLADHRITVRTGSASDATPAVRRQLALAADPWPEAGTVDTTRPLDTTLEQVRRLVGVESGA
jgi:predicted kinase